jgi:hypothetical protein
MEQRAPGTLQVWAEPFTPLRVAKFFDLRADPYRYTCRTGAPGGLKAELSRARRSHNEGNGGARSSAARR